MANNQQPRYRTPTEAVIEMQQQGRDDAEIITFLTNQGLRPNQISDAINQAKIKQAVSAKSIEAPMPVEAPEGLSPSIMQQQQPVQESEEIPIPGRVGEGQMPMQEQYYGYEQQGGGGAGLDTEAIEEIAEGIISEKWDEAKAKIISMGEWKDYADNRLQSVESKMKRVESSLDNLQAALLGKVQKYEQSIRDLGTEMKSVQGAFSKVLSPMEENIKELQRLSGKLKTSEHHAEHHAEHHVVHHPAHHETKPVVHHVKHHPAKHETKHAVKKK